MKLAFPGFAEDPTGLGLKDANEVYGSHVRLVFGALLSSELALVALVSQFGDVGLDGRVRAEGHNRPGRARREATSQGIEDAVEDGSIASLIHCWSIPRRRRQGKH